MLKQVFTVQLWQHSKKDIKPFIDIFVNQSNDMFYLTQPVHHVLIPAVVNELCQQTLCLFQEKSTIPREVESCHLKALHRMPEGNDNIYSRCL